MYSNPKVKAKLFKDSKSTIKKKPRSTNEPKAKPNLFPGVILPFKKKSSKKLFIKPEIKTEPCEEKDTTLEENIIVKKNNFDFPKPSSLKKNNWVDYIKQGKPERIKIEQPDNRKFFKSTIIHSSRDTLSK